MIQYTEIKDNNSKMELESDLLTKNYTKITCENSKDWKFNVPHHFEVSSVEKEEVVGKVNFQEGPIKENGVNGVSNEDLINMIIARLEAFQRTDYNCPENAMAITKLEESLMWLRKRTNSRSKRGVEGTSTI